MKALILSIVQYKEKDAIVQAISEDESFSFLAKGILNPKNQNAAINNPLTLAEIDLSDRTDFKHRILKSATVISSPLAIKNNLENLVSIQVITETIIKCLSDEDKPKVFQLVIDSLEALKKEEDYLRIVLLIIANILKFAGYGFEVDHCLFCGHKKDIVNFSFVDGGFICRNCNDESKTNLFDIDEMLYIRYLFKTDSVALKPSNDVSQSSKAKILSNFIQFIKDNLGTTIKSSELFLK